MGKEGSSPVPRRRADRRWLACGLCLLVLVLAVLAGASQQHVNTKRQQHHFQQAVDQVAESLTTRMEAFEHGLRGARGAIISAGPQLDRERFLAYSLSREYSREFPGVRGFGYIQRVPPDEEAAFVQRARLDGVPGFDVHAMSPH